MDFIDIEQCDKLNPDSVTLSDHGDSSSEDVELSESSTASEYGQIIIPEAVMSPVKKTEYIPTRTSTKEETHVEHKEVQIIKSNTTIRNKWVLIEGTIPLVIEVPKSGMNKCVMRNLNTNVHHKLVGTFIFGDKYVLRANDRVILVRSEQGWCIF